MNKNDMADSLERELHRLHYLGARPKLRPYIKYPEFFELLLLIKMKREEHDMGIEDYLNCIKSKQVNRVTVRNFIRDRVADGSILAQPGKKKSSRILRLNEDLEEELHQYLQEFASTYHKIVETNKDD
jgi:hypothetical protein